MDPEDYWIHQFRRLPDLSIRNAKKINADFLFHKITELHYPEEERVVWVLCVFWKF